MGQKSGSFGGSGPVVVSNPQGGGTILLQQSASTVRTSGQVLRLLAPNNTAAGNIPLSGLQLVQPGMVVVRGLNQLQLPIHISNLNPPVAITQQPTGPGPPVVTSTSLLSNILTRTEGDHPSQSSVINSTSNTTSDIILSDSSELNKPPPKKKSKKKKRKDDDLEDERESKRRPSSNPCSLDDLMMVAVKEAGIEDDELMDFSENTEVSTSMPSVDPSFAETTTSVSFGHTQSTPVPIQVSNNIS